MKYGVTLTNQGQPARALKSQPEEGKHSLRSMVMSQSAPSTPRAPATFCSGAPQPSLRPQPNRHPDMHRSLRQRRSAFPDPRARKHTAHQGERASGVCQRARVDTRNLVNDRPITTSVCCASFPYACAQIEIIILLSF